MEQEQSAYITSLHLKGYKSIRDLSVDLKQGLNIIIGPNGSGKTNFFAFLDAACRSDYAQLFNGQNRKFGCDILGKPFSTKIKGEKLIKNDIKNASYRVEKITLINDLQERGLFFLNEDKKIIKTEGGNSDDNTGFLFSTFLLRFENPLNNSLKEKFTLNLSRFDGVAVINDNDNPNDDIEVAYNLLDTDLKSDNDASSFIHRIFFSNNKDLDIGQNMSYIISEIIEDKYFIIIDLQYNLKQFSPIKDIRIDWGLIRKTIHQDDDGGETALIEGFYFQFFINDEWINWNQLSDGTKRLFYLIGSVTYAKENEIILIEEPELGIHPHQLSQFMNFLKAQSVDKQIIISTHAPEVLNCLKEDEIDRIVIARHEGKAGTKMYKLGEKEQKSVQTYMKHQASISDYWLQTGFEKEDKEEVEA